MVLSNVLLQFVPSGVLEGTTDTVDTHKNIIMGLLVFCLLVDPVVATFTWLHCQKTAVKREVKRQMIAGFDKDELVIFQFTKEEVRTELRWEHPQEFEYEQQMYDVVIRMTVGNTVYFWCWLDHEETKLNRRMEKLTAQTFRTDHDSRDKHERMISFFKSLYCPVYSDWYGPTPSSLAKQFCPFLDLYASITIQPPTPPPQRS